MGKNDKENLGLCFRCEYRARFLETGVGPRHECGTIDHANYSCYMYTPTRPLVIAPNDGEKRSPLSPWMLSARCHATEIANARLSVKINGDKYLKYWIPVIKKIRKKKNK